MKKQAENPLRSKTKHSNEKKDEESESPDIRIRPKDKSRRIIFEDEVRR
jgi:hypothetical protein